MSTHELVTGQLVWTTEGDELKVIDIVRPEGSEDPPIVRCEDGMLYELEFDGTVWEATLIDASLPEG